MSFLNFLPPADMSQILDGTSTESIMVCVNALRRGEIVAIPTETVYGLAAAASNREAIKKIFLIKGRPESHPLILHISDIKNVETWASDISFEAQKLAKTYWPGPLTLILRRTDEVCDEITGGRETVAIRCPAHPVAQQLLKRLNDAVVAPSANKFGKVSPTRAQHVLDDLANESPLILDGGECTIGLESTIIDCTVEPFQLLRSGAITAEQIWTDCKIEIVEATGESRASGMLDKHYAPKCRLVLANDELSAQQIFNSLNTDETKVRILQTTDSLIHYAQSLYANLRQADSDAIDVVIAIRAPLSGLGIAINERLEKAAN